MKLTKAQLKGLKLYASKLPTVMHTCIERHIYTGAELIEMDEVPEGVTVDPEKKYPYHYPVQIAANHYRRLRRAFERNGPEGVKAYIDNINAMAKRQELSKINS